MAEIGIIYCMTVLCNMVWTNHLWICVFTWTKMERMWYGSLFGWMILYYIIASSSVSCVNEVKKILGSHWHGTYQLFLGNSFSLWFWFNCNVSFTLNSQASWKILDGQLQRTWYPRWTDCYFEYARTSVPLSKEKQLTYRKLVGWRNDMHQTWHQIHRGSSVALSIVSNDGPTDLYVKHVLCYLKGT